MTHHSSDFSRYRDKHTAQFAEGKRVKAFQSFEEQVRKRLVILEEADSLRDLMLLPSNRFQALGGKRKGNTAFASMNSGGFALNGPKIILNLFILKLLIIIKLRSPYHDRKTPNLSPSSRSGSGG